MAVDTCKGEKDQSHEPKLLEDGKKAALIGGVIAQFAIGPWCSPALRLVGVVPCHVWTAAIFLLASAG